MLTIVLYIFSFIRTLFVFAILYLVIRWLSKFFSPSQNKSGTNSKFQDAHKQGETTIRFNEKGKKIVDKDKGEYVDFEEVD
ncbi:MAG: hypothetical protein ACERKD_23900 [Prolixibacteraceae bacterium]